MQYFETMYELIELSFTHVSPESDYEQMLYFRIHVLKKFLFIKTVPQRVHKLIFDRRFARVSLTLCILPVKLWPYHRYSKYGILFDAFIYKKNLTELLRRVPI